MEKRSIASEIFYFWSCRQGECAKALDIVPVKWIGGGRPNCCMANARNLWNVDKLRFEVVSGWLITTFDRRMQWRYFAQHWWNFDRVEQCHVDPTPDIEHGSIYMVDIDIRDFVFKNDDRLIAGERLVDVALKDEKLLLVRPYGEQFMVREPDNLSTQTLYEPVLRAGE